MERPLEERPARSDRATLLPRQLIAEQFIGGAEHIVRRDRQQAGIGLGAAGVVAAAAWAAQHAGARAVRAVAAGIGGTVDADDRAAESAGQMQRSSVSANAEGNAARERNQLRQSCGERNSAAGSNGSGERFFPRPGIDHHVQSALCKPFGNSGVALRRPALGAPAGTRSDERDGPRGARKCGRRAKLRTRLQPRDR